jgi:hypothetical protein
MYREWTKIDYQGKHCITDQTDKGTYDRGRDGRTNFTLRIKEQATRLTPLYEHDDDGDIIIIIISSSSSSAGSRWSRDLRRRSTAARLLRSWVRIPPGLWMFVCCVCCVLSGRGLCDELITRPEESNWMWRVVVCDHETSWTRRP